MYLMQQNQDMPTIFIAIADYRDSECIHTLKSIFNNAAHPERICVGVCDQYDDEQRLSEVIDHLPEKQQVRIDEMHYTESQGSGFAWNRAHALNRGETYSLQIHAHMRFLKNWDVDLIMHYEACPSDKAYITYYSPPYTPPNKLSSDSHAWRRVCVGSLGKQGDAQLIHLNRQIINEKDTRQGMYPSPFIVFNFIFAKTEYFQAMPFDPHIFFWGEEIAYSARLWTHGYDIYQLPNKLAYHQWHERDTTKTQDFFHRQHPKNIYSYHRMCHLFNLPIPSAKLDKDPLEELSMYEMGSSRALAAWLDFCGVNLQKRTISKAAKLGFWDMNAYKNAQKQLERNRNGDKHARPHSLNKLNSQRRQMVAKSKIQDVLVCIATSDHAQLSRSLISIFDNAHAPEKIMVSIAWTSATAYAIPDELKDFSSLITVRSVAASPIYNMLHEAIAAWNQQPNILTIRAGVELAKGWDVLVGDASAALKTPAFITQIATSPDALSPARIAAIPLVVGESRLIAVGKADATKTTKTTAYRELESTPLVSFDFLMADASTWFNILPDPYLTSEFEDVVYSARLWTHGVPAYQLNQMLVRNSKSDGVFANKNATTSQALIRTKHMLGIAYSDDNSALFKLNKYGHGESHDVETFWSALCADITNPVTVTNVAENKMPRIFVQIASYRDKQCQYTVKDLFDKATHPDRVFVGICWQTIPEEDEDCFLIVTRPNQVRIVHFNAQESKGACWARHHNQKLWQGEEFTLQIDSHMRFVQGWDETLLKMYRSLPSHKAVLTTYPAGFTPPADFMSEAAYMLVAKGFNKGGIFTMNSKLIKKTDQIKPVPGAFVSACFLFGPATMIQDVPYDPYIYFFGEEISLSVRLWTHGYDIYHPHQHIAWHDWKRANRKTTHFKDHQNWSTLNNMSFARVKYILGGNSPTESKLKNYVTQELQHYGLGKVRTLQEYQKYAGVIFKDKHIDEKAYRGIFSKFVHQSDQKLLPTVYKHASAFNPSDVSMTIQSASVQTEPFINPIRPMIATKGSKLVVPSKDIMQNHMPIKTYESQDVTVYDNFLPEAVYEKLYEFSVATDYKHINTTGNVQRVWNLDNGFPLRSNWNHYYEVLNQKKHPAESTYPLNKPNDLFIEHLNALAPTVQNIIGVPGIDWAHYSLTSWLYPPNTGLSLHNDGSNYTGAYVYFMNKEWRIHWGGLLMVLDRMANDSIEAHKKEHNSHKFHREKWLHESEHNDYAMEVGFARTILPKRNRIVFIAPDAYHIVSKVLPSAGDNVRMTLAGFFNRGVLNKKPQSNMNQSVEHGE